MQETNRFWILTGKYLKSEQSEQEQSELLQLLEEDPLLREIFEEAREAIAASDPEWSIRDLKLLLQTRLKIRAYEAGELAAPPLPPDGQEEEQEAAGRRVPIHRGWRKWIAAAAVFAGIGVLIYLFYQKRRPVTDRPAAWISLSVPPGRQKKLLLPDSTVVYVNGGSRLEYPPAFTDSIREVRLSGEAFFGIARNAKQPFIVQSGLLRTRVLGTEFNVHAYPGDETQTVLVTSGKVQVSAGGKVLDVLLPKHLLTYAVRKNSYVTTRQAVEAMDWLHGRMAFNDISFKDLAGNLGRRYGKTILFADTVLENCRFQAAFDNEPLEKILQQLSVTSGFSYAIRGDTVWLKGKGCF